MFELTNLDAIQIGMASPEQIRQWSHGEVTKPETINYRTLKPEKDGLYCERIFGPTKDWECACGKHKRIRPKDKNLVCDKCGVSVTRAKVRRERMGHIELAAPVSHIWYYKGIPSRMGMLLELSPRVLDKVLYFANFIVLDPGNTAVTNVALHDLINDDQYRAIMEKPDRGSFKAMMGAEAVQTMLRELDLDKLSAELKAEIETLTSKERNRDTEGQKRAHAVKRLEETGQHHPYGWFDEDLQLAHYKVEEDSVTIGKTLLDLALRESYGCNVLQAATAKQIYDMPGASFTISAGATLLVIGTKAHFKLFNAAIANKNLGLTITDSPISMRKFMLINEAEGRSDIAFMPCAISIDKHSPLLGKSIKSTNIRNKWHCLVIGLERGSYTIVNPNISLVFEKGDLLWVLGKQKMINQLVRDEIL